MIMAEATAPSTPPVLLALHPLTLCGSGNSRAAFLRDGTGPPAFSKKPGDMVNVQKGRRKGSALWRRGEPCLQKQPGGS